MQHLLRNKKGFTLVELLVVIAIIGLLAGVVVVAVGPARKKARDARRISDIQALQAAIAFHMDENGGAAPSTAQGIAKLVTDGHIARIPTDPSSGANFVITNAGAAAALATYFIPFTTETVTSLGAIGQYCATSVGIELLATCVEK